MYVELFVDSFAPSQKRLLQLEVNHDRKESQVYAWSKKTGIVGLDIPKELQVISLGDEAWNKLEPLPELENQILQIQATNLWFGPRSIEEKALAFGIFLALFNVRGRKKLLTQFEAEHFCATRGIPSPALRAEQDAARAVLASSLARSESRLIPAPAWAF